MPANLVQTHQFHVAEPVSMAHLQTLWMAMTHDPDRHLWENDWSPKTFAAWAGNPDRVILVSMDGEQVAGMCVLHDITADPTTRKPLHCQADLYLMAPWRGRQGLEIGRLFVQTVIDRLTFEQIFVVVRVEHRACQHYLGALSFHRIGVIPRYIPVQGVLHDAVLYAAVPPTAGGHDHG